MKKYFRLSITALIAAAALASCNSLEVTMPVGPRGEQGIQGVPGKDGLSAYELWVKAVQEKQVDYTGPVDINHFFIYLKGKDGKDGKDGVDGKSAYELWKEYIASGVDDPHNPGSQWDKSRTSTADFFWFLTGDNGSDGLIPYIKDGNWWIGDSDTGVKARGEKGDTGASGKDGVDGLNAYEMWKKYVRETIESGGSVSDQNGNEITLEDLSILKFFQYLTGKAGEKGDKGDSGLDGKDGKDGVDGKNGLTPEIDHKTGEWIFVDKESGDTVFTHISSKGLDGKDGVDGNDGKDGITPNVGSNGNWWIGGVDTGIKAQGPKGDTGASGTDGKDGADGKDGSDGRDGKDGANGSAGKSAYELWVADVLSASGLEDPKNPEHKWDPSKTSVADFYEYLRGASGASGSDGKDGNDGADGSAGKDGADGKDGSDGADGRDGKSAYDLWKELVLSEDGLDNPDNGVYDITLYPKWPRTAVSVLDFFKYLRGSDGEPATSLAVVDTLYVEEADWTKYNVAPVRSMAKVRTVSETRDTTYEYVNPYSGGCALIVTEPGPMAIPNCTVKFNDQDGNTYEKTSDERGYIYLTRDELPDWHEGASSINDLSSRTRPSSFSFNGKTITDDGKIAATCGVPYKVLVDVRMTESRWETTTVTAGYVITRTVEGKDETGWGGVDFPNCKTNAGYFMYRCLNDVNKFRGVTLRSYYGTPDKYIVGDHFMKFSNPGIDNRWSRSLGTVESTMTKSVKFGDGASPSIVDVNYIPIVYGKNWSEYRESYPDYGLKLESSDKTIIPEYCAIGNLNVVGVKGGSDDEQYTSYNGKLVFTADGTTNVPVNKTNYELILGQTSFCFSFDYSTFGHVYKREAYYDSANKTFRFKRYDTLQDYLSQTKTTLNNKFVTLFSNEGSLSGVRIKNTISVYMSTKDGVIIDDNREPFIIRNVYNRFNMEFSTFSFDDVFYEGVSGVFHYKESEPYVASCTLGGKNYVFQAIQDGKSAPLP